ncbi:MAG: LysE family translocator [Alphaproteobacteria bacterium]|nr:LysE family translocator [Alphaproteobacteria bacterium]
MGDFLHWLLFLSVCTTASISPGPAFLIILRNALTYGRRSGIATAVGLSVGIIPPILMTLFGIAALLTSVPLAFMAIKVIGASYLFYMGVSALRSPMALPEENDTVARATISDLAAFRQGVITNITNPKGWLYFIALFSQFIEPTTPIGIKLLYGTTNCVVEALWFSLVATLLNTRQLRPTFDRFMGTTSRVCGVLFIGLALKVFVDAFK